MDSEDEIIFSCKERELLDKTMRVVREAALNMTEIQFSEVCKGIHEIANRADSLPPSQPSSQDEPQRAWDDPRAIAGRKICKELGFWPDLTVPQIRTLFDALIEREVEPSQEPAGQREQKGTPSQISIAEVKDCIDRFERKYRTGKGPVILSWEDAGILLGQFEAARSSSPSREPQNELLTAEEVAGKLAGSGGIERWAGILDEWLQSYLRPWKEEERIRAAAPSREPQCGCGRNEGDPIHTGWKSRCWAEQGHHEFRPASAPLREWIKREDRLPDGQMVLAFVPQNIMGIAFLNSQGIWMWPDTPDDREAIGVTHWMPLPEPPEEIIARHAATIPVCSRCGQPSPHSDPCTSCREKSNA
jgi:Protein of unknown function (DUF551)